MVLQPANDRHSRARVARVFRTVRKALGFSSLQVAQAMGMPHRSYQALEAGAGQPEIGDLEAYATATGIDPAALFFAILCDAPAVAFYCSQNKLMVLACLELGDLIQTLGPGAADLTPRQVIATIRRLEPFVRQEFRIMKGFEAWLDRRLGRGRGLSGLFSAPIKP